VDDALKKRLIGAVVLVSLVVIFVPMLVEDEPAVSPQITETNIPLRPNLPEPAQESEREGVVAPDAADGEGAGAPPAISLPLPPAEPAGAPPPAVEPPPEATPEEPAPTAPVQTPAPKPASKPTEPPPSRPSGWVVQVASFSDKGNADQTLARLRLEGYDSFLEQINVKGKMLYRVRVGPEVERARADALQGRIARELKLQGQVLRYP